ncbi:PepSY domain-containing protein [Thiohalomonas denitrificans]|uniref:PepSY domain-containing protein n=1 Tax=Thiohalomonas denitrificans TaxID=415747 RepID=UPI0026F292B1|nr:PepSY domain-containing protein [Thiohalomonas denitrificans]
MTTIIRRPLWLLGILAILALAVLLSPPLVADDDHETARRLRESGQLLPLEQILESARAVQSGQVLEVELEKPGKGREHQECRKGYCYELKLLTPEGRVEELLFDAGTGEFLGFEDRD